MKIVDNYLVYQVPKQQYRKSHVVVVLVVEASSRAEAIRTARVRGAVDSYALEYKKPQARLLDRDRIYSF